MGSIERTRSVVLLVALLGAACGSDETKGKPTGTVDASTEGGAGAGGAAGKGGGGGSIASPDASSDAVPDATSDAPEDVPTDRFADAPPRPGPTDPMAVVLFGELDGIDLTGSYTYPEKDDAGAPTDVCGAGSGDGGAAAGGFRISRSDEFEGTVVDVRYSDPVATSPPVGTYDQFDWWDFTISRFAKIDGATKLVTFRAGQVTTGSELLGDVRAQNLEGAGMLDAFFHLTKARRIVDTDEGLKDGDLYLWIAGTCR